MSSLDCPDCTPDAHDLCDGPHHYRCEHHRRNCAAEAPQTTKRWVSWSTFRNGSNYAAVQSKAHLLVDPDARRAVCGVRIPRGGLAEDRFPSSSKMFRNVFDDPDSDTRQAAVCTGCEEREVKSGLPHMV